MDDLEPLPLFNSLNGLEVPSGERCQNEIFFNRTWRYSHNSPSLSSLMAINHIPVYVCDTYLYM